ncbi:MAG TPA: alkaline phosphatase family protein [Acidimicrobiales bacterium]|jgi:phospholipase C|nr:alkaline phosphatase family protein [Acidimicrobiales bacterium]
MGNERDEQTGASPGPGAISRRDVLKAGAAAAAGVAGVAGLVGAAGSGLRPEHARLIDSALANAASSGTLKDVKHIVILMQENRSFDHYYGTMPGVRNFADTQSYSSYAGGPSTNPSTVFSQTMVDGTGKPLYKLASGEQFLDPFELVSNPPTVAGQTTNDITHDWGPQHLAWNNGAMDQWAVQHLLNDPISKFQFNNTLGLPIPGASTVPTGLTTMGYYRQSDCLAFYRALADAFTICDGYHCSVLGPTDPNRLMWMSGSLGAHSADKGGPVLTTYVLNKLELYGTLDWPTMPEVLTDHGVSWKVYQDPTGNVLFNVLDYFKNFTKPSTTAQTKNASLGLTPVYPVQFALDVATGTLPQVSWILPPLESCEHPAVPPEYGEDLVSQILQTLVSNPAVWEKTVFLVVYDENGGFFDHVAPPTPGPTVTHVADLPTGSQAGGSFDGEYVTTSSPQNAAGGPPSDWGGVLGPVGLGFRTPALVISPFSAGGWVCPDVFDHVSTLKFIEKVFLPTGSIMGSGGLHVSPWRYNSVGDLTAALPNLTAPTYKVPPLPATSLLFPGVAAQALLNALTGTEDLGPAYPPPPKNLGIPALDADSISRKPTPT